MHASVDDKLEHRRSYVYIFKMIHTYKRYKETAARLFCSSLLHSRVMLAVTVMLWQVLDLSS